MTSPSGLRRHRSLYLCLLLGLIVLVVGSTDPVDQLQNIRTKRMTRKEGLDKKRKEAEAYEKLRADGQDEVGHTEEAALMRKYQLRNKMRKGIFRKKHSDLASILFPGVSPETYSEGEEVMMYTDLVNSKKTQVPFEFYKLPGCAVPDMTP
jgi:hypothetical protein